VFQLFINVLQRFIGKGVLGSGSDDDTGLNGVSQWISIRRTWDRFMTALWLSFAVIGLRLRDQSKKLQYIFYLLPNRFIALM